MALLVTGGAGFIGSHLVEELLRRGREVVVLENFDAYYPEALKRANLARAASHPAFHLVEGDIRNAQDLERAVKGRQIEAILHMAARPGVRASLTDPAVSSDINVVGTARVLELARRLPVRRFIFASSSSVYGERTQAPFREEDAFHHPQSPYAATKAAGEMLCWTYHRLFGMDMACLRFFTVYGPRQRPEMAIHHFTRLIERGEEVPVFGDGSARRDFTYVDDIVAGVVGALERAQGYRVYNLGNSRTVEVREMVRVISEALGKPARVKHVPLQPGDVSLTYASIERASQELGFRPSTPLEEGVAHFVKWYRGEGKPALKAAGLL